MNATLQQAAQTIAIDFAMIQPPPILVALPLGQQTWQKSPVYFTAQPLKPWRDLLSVGHATITTEGGQVFSVSVLSLDGHGVYHGKVQ